MNQCFVYLILDLNRLIILTSRFDNPNYKLLMDNNGGPYNTLYDLCKVFCIGYILGTENGKRPTNDIQDFQ